MSTLMNRAGWVVAVALAVFVAAALAGVARGGPLDPPGPVASTGKGQITALPAVIDTPGSYLVTANLSGSGAGITINVSDVTIDFQGFTLTGPGAASPGTGVSIPAAQSNITLKDGTLRGWRDGVSATSTTYARIDGLTAIGTDTGVSGTGVTLGAHSIVEGCNISAFRGSGIIASFVTIRGCIIADNDVAGISSAEGSYVHDNLIRNNGKGVVISGAGIKPGAAFNYVRDNHICYNTLDIERMGEDKNVWVGNTFATSSVSIAPGTADLFNVVALDTASTNYRPDLNNVQAAGDPRFGDCAK
ncbi:MAG: right-handed parallel beta-helix repeat-containing protein [Chloroflexi bacterium]|nr:right-handed parallel beta-helix repeat-containing protein [Chloroflexota bacterium]